MAHSRLRDIYKALEDTGVFFDGAIVRCRGLDNLDTKVARASLPLRILLPVGSNANGRSIIILDAAATGRSAVWTIPELALLGLVSQGQGLEDFAGQLIDYVVAFEQAVLDRRTKFTGFIVNNLAVDTGMFEWPAGSSVWHFGVKVVYTVTELI